MSSQIAFVTISIVWAGVFSPSAAAAVTCESMKSLSLPNVTITLAESVTPGAFFLSGTQPGSDQNAVFRELPAFCRVAATLRPSSDSDIKIEVWMPFANWNNKFQAVGNGGLAGSISYAAMADAVKRGYATTSTDTGHSGSGASFALGHPEKITDFGYRAVHEMTINAKAIINAYYGTAPKFSYWNSCSTGGRQGLIEAQRFPDDFDGIIAGAPANPLTHLAAWGMYVGQTAGKDTSYIPPAKYPMIHDAVIAACDLVDGLKDGLIDDPRRCSFDFKTLECKGDDGPSCLTMPQVETAKKLTSPAVFSSTRPVSHPGLALGTELGWATKAGLTPNPLNIDQYKFIWFQDEKWDWRSFELERDFARAVQIDKAVTSATADLSAFAQRGGKLLLYQGWSDQNIPPVATIDYYEAVVANTGSVSNRMDWVKLFMAPGMAHCRGGEGPNTFDVVAALEQWVEQGKPPEQIVASRSVGGRVIRTRPLCPYPQIARYKGTGSIDDAANFQCRLP